MQEISQNIARIGSQYLHGCPKPGSCGPSDTLKMCDVESLMKTEIKARTEK